MPVAMESSTIEPETTPPKIERTEEPTRKRDKLKAWIYGSSTPKESDDSEKKTSEKIKKKDISSFMSEEDQIRLRMPTSEILKDVHEMRVLKSGRNTLVFTLQIDDAETDVTSEDSIVECDLYLYDSSDKLIVTDVDGTISKSDARGQFMHHFGYDWSHEGTVPFFNHIESCGYKIVYLTARSIGMARRTKEWLFEYVSSKQSSETELEATDAKSSEDLEVTVQRLPRGPLLLSPGSTMSALKREVYHRKPQVCYPPFDYVSVFVM